MLRLLALLPALPLVSGAAFAQEAPPPVEIVPPWQALVMLLFLIVAALIIVSILCKAAIALGLVPMKPKTRLDRAIHRLARVVGNVERKESRRSSAGRMRGGGGSFGGGGSSGNY
jgi:uncharacterized membrane protein YgcG